MRWIHLSRFFTVTIITLLMNACGDQGIPGAGPDSASGQTNAQSVSALSITSITPAISSTTGGGVVDVTGTGFLANATVFINQKPAVTTWVSDSHLKVMIPAMIGTQGNVSFRVTNHGADGEHSTSAPHGFTYYSSTLAFGDPLPLSDIASTGNLLSVDMDGDGKSEVVALQQSLLIGMTNIDMFTFDPLTQRFEKTPLASTSSAPELMVTYDLNADGKNDLILGTAKGVMIYYNNGSGKLLPPITIETGWNGYFALIPADFNGDGKTDIGVLVGSYAGTLLSDGKGGFQRSKFGFAGKQTWAAAAIDFNHDGHLDLLVNNAKEINFLQANGDGTFQIPTALDSFPPVNGLVVGDVNGDKALDIVMTTDEKMPKLVVMLDHDHAFQTQESIDAPKDTYSPWLYDVNGDQVLDLVESNIDGGYFIWINKGNGSFSSFQSFQSVEKSWTIGLGDVNGDQKLDVFSSHNIGDGSFVNLQLNESQ